MDEFIESDVGRLEDDNGGVESRHCAPFIRVNEKHGYFQDEEQPTPLEDINIDLIDFEIPLNNIDNQEILKAYLEDTNLLEKGDDVDTNEERAPEEVIDDDDLFITEYIRIHLGCERRWTLKKCGCSFHLIGLPQSNDRWKLQVIYGTHNHPRSKSLLGYSFAGRLNEAEIRYLHNMSTSGIVSCYILSNLKEMFPNNVSYLKIVYNVIHQLKTLQLKCRTTFQTTTHLLNENDYIEWHTVDDQNRVTNIFWSHAESIKLAKCFPSVMLMNCTYKTNRYRMSLFEVVGVTSTNKTFNVGCCFVSFENEELYTWILEKPLGLFEPNNLLTVFVTNRELGLIKAIETVFLKQGNCCAGDT